jgi:hypothetical protein
MPLLPLDIRLDDQQARGRRQLLEMPAVRPDLEPVADPADGNPAQVVAPVRRLATSHPASSPAAARGAGVRDMAGLWYCASLTTEQISDGAVGIIQRLFMYATRRSPDGDGVCLFATSHDTRAGRLRENAEDDTLLDADAVFFSPASVRLVPHLIAYYAAQPSHPPDRSRAALLVGTVGDWDLLPWTDH